MEIDHNILSALKALAKDVGKIAEIAKKTDIYGTNFTRWKDGQVKTISEKNYEMIYPHIQQYLPAGPQYWPRSKLIAEVQRIEEKIGYLFSQALENTQKQPHDQLKKELCQELNEDSEPFIIALDYISHLGIQTDEDKERIKDLKPDEQTLLRFWSKLDDPSKSQVLRMMNQRVFESWERNRNQS